MFTKRFMRGVGSSFLAAHVRRCLWRAVKVTASELDGEDMRRPAIVFAPHPDDETLGCGGTIVKKVRAGAGVRVVFVTDGGGSHAPLISRAQLKAMRAREALAAAKVLGVQTENVIFMEFPDTMLCRDQAAAGRRIAQILARDTPDQAFVPYRYETPLDHYVTNRIVVSAIRNLRKDVRIYEYPVWLWSRWPWASQPLRRRRDIPARVKSSFLFGVRLLRDFQCAVYVGDVLEQKRAALRMHRSQMERLVSSPRWATLGDVGNGEFLNCFFQKYEIFRRYTCGAGHPCDRRPVSSRV